jgi:N6-adenosine-specific RNA methylase IME4
MLRWAGAIARSDRVEAPPLPPNTFFVVYADPPWTFENTGFTQSAAQQYPTLSTEAVCALPVEPLCADRGALFLWVPNALLPDGLRVCEAWGFDYKTNFCWIKDRAPGVGFYSQSKHEAMLLAVRGDQMLPQERPDSWFEAPVTDHSRKPDRAYTLIEAMYSGPYVELFARQTRPGWTAWGNEIPVPLPIVGNVNAEARERS